MFQTEERRRSRFAQLSFSAVVIVQSCSCSSSLSMERRPEEFERRRGAPLDETLERRLVPIASEGSNSGSLNWILGDNVAMIVDVI